MVIFLIQKKKKKEQIYLLQSKYNEIKVSFYFGRLTKPISLVLLNM